MAGNETPFAARVAVVLKLPSTQHNSYRRGAPRGSRQTRALAWWPGRDGAVRVVQPPLPMLDQRRHDWQRNTFRCTCCCCSQITKYPTQLVPPWRAQGSGLTRVGGFLWARHERYASCSHPCPGQTSDDMAGNETPFAARVAVVLKLPSTQHNSYRRGTPRGSSKRVRWPGGRARRSGTRRAATLAQARPATT